MGQKQLQWGTDHKENGAILTWASPIPKLIPPPKDHMFIWQGIISPYLVPRTILRQYVSGNSKEVEEKWAPNLKNSRHLQETMKLKSRAKLWALYCKHCKSPREGKYMWIGVGRDSFIANTGGVGVGSRNKHMAYKKIITVHSFVKRNGFVSVWS